MGCTFYTLKSSLHDFPQVNLSQYLVQTHSSCCQWAFHTLYAMFKLRRILAGVLPTAQSTKCIFLWDLTPTSSPSSCEYNSKVEIEILRPETYFFFLVLMTFLFRYIPQASSVYIAELKSAAFCFHMLVGWRGFTGIGSRFRRGRLKECELVNFSFATLCKLQRYNANGNKDHNVINNAMREFS